MSAYEWPTRPIFIAGQCLNGERPGTLDLIGGAEPCPTGVHDTGEPRFLVGRAHRGRGNVSQPRACGRLPCRSATAASSIKAKPFKHGFAEPIAACAFERKGVGQGGRETVLEGAAQEPSGPVQSGLYSLLSKAQISRSLPDT